MEAFQQGLSPDMSLLSVDVDLLGGTLRKENVGTPSRANDKGLQMWNIWRGKALNGKVL